jgi:hypothetical protein
MSAKFSVFAKDLLLAHGGPRMLSSAPLKKESESTRLNSCSLIGAAPFNVSF